MMALARIEGRRATQAGALEMREEHTGPFDCRIWKPDARRTLLAVESACLPPPSCRRRSMRSAQVRSAARPTARQSMRGNAAE